MAAAHGHPADGGAEETGGAEGTAEADEAGRGAPRAFRRAVAELLAAPVRSGVLVSPMAPPRRLAPFAYALEGIVPADGTAGGDDDPEEAADGRLVLLHDPAGQSAWRGTFRVVTLVRADVEPEIAVDPLLPEVCWSWLTGALAARGAEFTAVSGTVSRSSSHHFGALAERGDTTQIEVRASWTPERDAEGVPDTAAHLAAWCDLLCACAGLPPVPGDPAVAAFPPRRGPH